jgi:hypothetical protein
VRHARGLGHLCPGRVAPGAAQHRGGLDADVGGAAGVPVGEALRDLRERLSGAQVDASGGNPGDGYGL